MRVFNGNPGQSAKLNVRQSVFAAKSPNLMFTECTTPTVCTIRVKKQNPTIDSPPRPFD